MSRTISVSSNPSFSALHFDCWKSLKLCRFLSVMHWLPVDNNFHGLVSYHQIDLWGNSNLSSRALSYQQPWEESIKNLFCKYLNLFHWSEEKYLHNHPKDFAVGNSYNLPSYILLVKKSDSLFFVPDWHGRFGCCVIPEQIWIIIRFVQCIVSPNIDSGLTSLLSNTNVTKVGGHTLCGTNDFVSWLANAFSARWVS